jgi:hypothetical protein
MRGAGRLSFGETQQSYSVAPSAERALQVAVEDTTRLCLAREPAGATCPVLESRTTMWFTGPAGAL